ncbi:MAG TPA: phosphatidate cytidylyltransferase [Bacteroidales bacterium]|nr:phosphatidate cytidylyltransferase [Bacteroidales bacterium]HSA42890.1 phosphatidate cytidylyltransferase [Bacteroidales bacterium]
MTAIVNNFITRTISGLAFVLIVLGALFWHPLAFSALFLLVSLAGLDEFLAVVRKTGYPVQTWPPLFLACWLYLSLGLIAHDLLPSWSFFIVLVNVPLFFLPLLVELLTGKEKNFLRAGTGLIGVLYVVLPLGLLQFLYYPCAISGPADPVLPAAMFGLIWIHDTFAYLSGKLFGKHLLFERISPKKTWEGSAGGAVFCLLAAWAAASWLGVLTLPQWILFAVIVIVFGSLGDLSESMLKRKAGLKDSGNRIPGHGGILDRFDAVLMVAPVVFVMVMIICYL